MTATAPGDTFTRLRQRYEVPFWAGFVALVVFPWYFAINVYTSTRSTEFHDVALPIDHAWPFSPPWMLVYAFVYLAALFPVFLIRDRHLVRRIAYSYMFSLGCAFACFLVYPVTVRTFRPVEEVQAMEGFFAWGVALNYFWDEPNNCFPSLHLAITFAAAMGCLKADRLAGVIACAAGLLIGASTLYVKQHFLLDVASGIGLGVLGDAIFVAGYRRDPGADALEGPMLRPRAWIGAYLGVFGAIVLACYVAYGAGFRPWES